MLLLCRTNSLTYELYLLFQNGLTPLHLCAQEDRVGVAELLLKNNAQVDTPTKVRKHK